MEASTTSTLALIVSLSATSWTIWYNLTREKIDNVNRTVDLQFRFFESGMVDSREVGWYLLEEMEENQDLLTFKSLWDHDNEGVRHRFSELYRVINFWLVLYHLGNERKIDISLAKRIFSYEYDWWFWRLQRLVHDTVKAAEKPSDIPDAFLPFSGDGISWLERSPETKPSRRIRT